MTIRIVIIDPQSSFTEGMSGLLSQNDDMEVLEVASSSVGALDLLDRRRPDVVLLDIDLVRDALSLLARARERDEKVRFIALTGQTGARVAFEAVRAGAAAFVVKSAPITDFLAVIRGVAAGESHIPPELLTDVLRALQGNLSHQSDVDIRLGRLSARELEVLTLMVDGLPRPAIAERLFISSNTVRTHNKNILAKLEVHSSLQAVSLALRGGLRPHGEDSGTRGA
jgi:DNA-binding NarL/FixJ family response regulator